jgi:hypothetical protein
LEVESVEEERLVVVGLGVAGEDDGAAVSGGDLHVEHLHRAHLRESFGWSEARSEGLEPLLERDPEAIGHKADKDMCLDAVVFLVMDRADRQVVFHLLEDLFDLGELEVIAPEFSGIVVAEVAAQKVAAFAAIGLAVFFPMEAEGDRGLVRESFCGGDLDVEQGGSDGVMT